LQVCVNVLFCLVHCPLGSWHTELNPGETSHVKLKLSGTLKQLAIAPKLKGEQSIACPSWHSNVILLQISCPSQANPLLHKLLFAIIFSTTQLTLLDTSEHPHSKIPQSF
jgi:hypothetical protein